MSVRRSNNIAAIINYGEFIELYSVFAFDAYRSEFHTTNLFVAVEKETLYEFKWHPYGGSRKQWRCASKKWMEMKLKK